MAVPAKIALASAEIRDGTENDTIYGNTSNGHLYQYNNGDGNDVIYSFGSNDPITISGATYTKSTVGNDVLIRTCVQMIINLVFTPKFKFQFKR